MNLEPRIQRLENIIQNKGLQKTWEECLEMPQEERQALIFKRLSELPMDPRFEKLAIKDKHRLLLQRLWSQNEDNLSQIE